MNWTLALQLMLRYGPEAVQRIIEIIKSNPDPSKEAFDAIILLALKPMDSYIKEATQRAIAAKALLSWMPFSTQKFVLLVDDEDIITKVFNRVFKDQSYALLDTANTVERALAKISFVAYDYVFLDMKIEGNTAAGMEILRSLNRMIIKVRSDKRAVMDSFVVIMSNSVPLQDVMAEANALGVLTFLDKPLNFTEEYLLRIVQRLGLPLLPRKSRIQ